jgi:GTP cyclohydrolase I
MWHGSIDFDDEMTDDFIANTGVDLDAAQAVVSQFLRTLGEKPEREGLRNTPKRVARMYAELLSGYHTDPEKVVNGVQHYL